MPPHVRSAITTRTRWTVSRHRSRDSLRCTVDCRRRIRFMESDVSAEHVPLVAILRGVKPDQVVGIGNVLYDTGIRMIEVPLTSPDRFASIAALAACGRCAWVVGARTGW